MVNEYKNNILNQLEDKYGKIKHIGNGNSLFLVESVNVVVYIRYSKILSRDNAFYGLRKEDISLMSKQKSYICFLTNNKDYNVVLPFQQFETYFDNSKPASDGQFKIIINFKPTGVELYIANIGKFNVEIYVGFDKLFNIKTLKTPIPKLTHSDVKSLISSIGISKGFSVWVPTNDKIKLNKNIVDFSKIRENLPKFDINLNRIISEIDVIWLDNTDLISFYEVEHSTPMHSGLFKI